MIKIRKGLYEPMKIERSELEIQPERGPIEKLFHLVWKNGIAIFAAYAALEYFFDGDVIDGIFDTLRNLWEST